MSTRSALVRQIKGRRGRRTDLRDEDGIRCHQPADDDDQKPQQAGLLHAAALLAGEHRHGHGHPQQSAPATIPGRESDPPS
ncbi:hypothetical protein [Micromonospora maris]|uniref:hypothetical protein n=1 Tax=Micromonospora maris TaxID=1003110 RepID=UPI0011D23899|nr:hypothetical protein [Micromonospora maris]